MHPILLLLALFTPLAHTTASPPPSLINTVSKAMGPAAISTLQIHAYTLPGCTGSAQAWDNATYGAQVPVQTRSYHLNRDLAKNEELDLFNVGIEGGAIDTSFDGDMLACGVLVETVGPGDLGRKGCNTLKSNVGCMSLVVK